VLWLCRYGIGNISVEDRVRGRRETERKKRRRARKRGREEKSSVVYQALPGFYCNRHQLSHKRNVGENALIF